MFLRVFGDFIIKKEHMFLKNIFSKEQLLKSLPISTFESFKKHFIEFLEIVIFLEEGIKSFLRISDFPYQNLTGFIEKHFGDFSTFDEIKQEINNVEVKGCQNLTQHFYQNYAFLCILKIYVF